MKPSSSKLFLLSICLIILNCEYFSTTTHTPKQIKKASEWSDKDQLPAFEDCQNEAEENRFSCFKNRIASTVNDALYLEELVANQEIDQEIILEIQISKDGDITLLSIDNASSVVNAMPELSTLLENAIASLPQALPATKTNVGVTVNSQIKLPIRVIASPQ